MPRREVYAAGSRDWSCGHPSRGKIDFGVTQAHSEFELVEYAIVDLVKGRRLKLFYATQPKNGGLLGSGSLGEADQSADRLREKASPFDKSRRNLTPPEFVLFVNDPHLITETYRRYLEARIREAEPYPGLPIVLTARARARDNGRR